MEDDEIENIKEIECEESYDEGFHCKIRDDVGNVKSFLFNDEFEIEFEEAVTKDIDITRKQPMEVRPI